MGERGRGNDGAAKVCHQNQRQSEACLHASNTTLSYLPRLEERGHSQQAATERPQNTQSGGTAENRNGPQPTVIFSLGPFVPHEKIKNVNTERKRE